MHSTRIYTIEVVTYQNIERFAEYLWQVGVAETELYQAKYNWESFDFAWYLSTGGHMRICLRNGEPVGLMMYRVSEPIFDDRLRVLKQDLLYCQSGTKAAKLLLDEFIDFGKTYADHIITVIGEKTNIKAKSLEKLGFSKLETLYRMEVKRGE